MGRFENTPWHFLYRQHILSIPQIPHDLDLSGQTAIITGSNTGLGFHSAQQLLNAHLSTLIIAVRNREKGLAAAEKLRDDFKTSHPDWPSTKIEVWDLDMSFYPSVLAFAQEIKNEAGHVDIAILNAGVQPNTWRLSPHGHEEAVQVNYLSTALLALELRKIMDASYRAALQGPNPPKKQPVLELVGSDATTFAVLPELKVAESRNLPLLQALKTHPTELGLKIDPMNRYGDSKLLEHSFFLEFIRHLSAPSSTGDGSSPNEVVVTLVSPGLCKTDLGKYEGIMAFFAGAFIWINGRRPEVGARTLTLGATNVYAKDHGTYVSEGAIFPQPDFLESEKGRETMLKLWEEMSGEFRGLGVDVEELLA